MLPKQLYFPLAEPDLLVAVVEQVVLVLVQQVPTRVDVVCFCIRTKVLDVRMREDEAFYFSGVEIDVLVMPVERLCGVSCELDGMSFYS
jgi:hypothetical protein